MRWLKKKHMRTLVRRFWGSIILLVLVIAVCVQLGREAFPMLNDYRGFIGEQFSKTLGVDVQIGGIEAKWVGLRPRLEFHDLVMQAEDGQQILVVGNLDGELSLIDSLLEWQLVWRHLEFRRLDMQFQQASDGHWTLGGLSLSRPRMDDESVISDPLDIFLLARHLTLNQSSFQFNFRTGHQAELSVPQLVLENEADFHRLVANFAVDGDEEAFSVVVEGHGNPRVEENFTAEGYIALDNFPMEKVVAALDIAAWDAADEGQWSEGHRLDASLWFSGSPYQKMSLKGRLQADGLPLKAPDDVQLPAGLSAQLTGHWQSGQGWQLALGQADLVWGDLSVPPFDVVFSGALGQPLSAVIDEVDLEIWHTLAEKRGLLQGRLKDVIAALGPTGKLSNIHIEQRPAKLGHFFLRANLHQLHVNGYRGAPAVDFVDGYLEASALGGRVIIDSRDGFTMFYPEVYHEPMTYSRASGEVRWAIRKDLQRVDVWSGRLSLSGEEGEGRGYIHLILPYGDRKHPGPQMTLLVGLRDSEARFHEKYVPYKVPDALYDWLQGSIQGGHISRAGFLWHGPLTGKSGIPPSIQLFGEVENAALQFDPEWPPLQQARGSLLLDNKILDVDISQGVLDSNEVAQTSVKVRPGPDGHMQLQIRGRAQGDLNHALHLLRNSPIGTRLGPQFSGWRGAGKVSADVELLVPLHGDLAAGRQIIRARIQNARLELPELKLTLEEINGPLQYTSAHGLQSTGLDLSLWERAAGVEIASEQVQGKPVELNINFKASASVEKLSEWLQRPELDQVAEGVVSAVGNIKVPFGEGPGGEDLDKQVEATQVKVSSDLAGVKISLPAPYGKAVQEQRSLELTVTLDEGQLYRLAYDHLLRLQFLLDEQLQSASLALGNKFAPIQRGYMDVSGHAGQVRLKGWLAVLDKIAPVALAGTKSAANWPLIPRFDVHLQSLQLEQSTLEQLHLIGGREQARWNVNVRSPRLFGEVRVFDDDRPLEVDLALLRLTEDAAAESGDNAGEPAAASSESRLAGIDISRLPAVNFSTASVIKGATDFGAWSFDLRPVNGGIALRNVTGSVMGATVSGSNPDDGGAELLWLQSPERNSTYLKGAVSVGDLADVSGILGQPEIMESDSARFDVELLWPGAPDEVDLHHLDGTIKLDIRDGRFIRGAEMGNNPFLRLFGLLNFDTLARRLKLDFSDLYKEGMVFDSVVGEMRFANGRVLVREPLRVESPSSTLQFTGLLDAETEQLDATLVATLPVTGNLAVAAAFVGGLPAAVGVFVVGKLFEEQVDKASSIRYRISGSWTDPDIRVDKIFESSMDEEQAYLMPPVERTSESSGRSQSLQKPVHRQPLSGEPELEARVPAQK